MRNAQADSETKRQLLEAAEELMLSKGYTAASVDEVCEAAGLTKGSFFHYFDGKEQLGKEVAERHYAYWQQLSQSAPFRRKKDPLDRVLGSVDFFVEMSRAPT